MDRIRLSRHVSLLRFLHRRISLVASATSGNPSPSPTMTRNTGLKKPFKHLKQWRKQLNYSNLGPGSRLSFPRQGRTCCAVFLRLLAHDSLMSVGLCCILVWLQSSDRSIPFDPKTLVLKLIPVHSLFLYAETKSGGGSDAGRDDVIF